MISSRQDGEHYHEHLEALRAGQRGGMMRIMRANMPDDCPRYIRMDALNEEWAMHNHGQSLTRLNERGGLSPAEAVAIMERHRWQPMPPYETIPILKRVAVSESDGPR